MGGSASGIDEDLDGNRTVVAVLGSDVRRDCVSSITLIQSAYHRAQYLGEGELMAGIFIVTTKYLHVFLRL
jgi:hypothetical protein